MAGDWEVVSKTPASGPIPGEWDVVSKTPATKWGKLKKKAKEIFTATPEEEANLDLTGGTASGPVEDYVGANAPTGGNAGPVEDFGGLHPGTPKAEKPKRKELTWRQGKADDFLPKLKTGSEEDALTPMNMVRSIVGRDTELAKILGMEERDVAARRGGIQKAKAAVKLAGGPDGEKGVDIAGEFSKNFADSFAMGIPSTIMEAAGLSVADDEPGSTNKQLAGGAGQLLGSIVGAPGKIAGAFTRRIEKKIPGLEIGSGDSALSRMGKQAVKEAGTVAAFSVADMGEILKQETFEDAIKVAAKKAAGGAQMGATFGVTKGIFPGNTAMQTIKRMAVGMAVLDAQRGEHPLDDRSLKEKIYAYGVDAYFLYRGLPDPRVKELERAILEIIKREQAKAQAPPSGEGGEPAQGPSGAPPVPVDAAKARGEILQLPELKITENSPLAKLQGQTEVNVQMGPKITAPMELARNEKGEIQTREDGGKQLVQVKSQNGAVAWVEAEKIRPAMEPLKLPEPPAPKEAGPVPDQAPAYEGATMEKGKFPVSRVAVKDIEADPERFQFKLNVNKSGEQVPLEGEWNDLAAGNLILWQDNGGRLFAANGHHRLAHAKRLGVEAVNAQILREADGYTVADARRIAAEANILEGKGTIYDHADFFRHEGGYDDTVAKARGVKGRGYSIGKFATDNTYSQFRNKDITPEQAEAISRSAPGDERLQNVGVHYALNNPKAEPYEIQSFIRAVGLDVPKGEQGDLFGYDDTAIREAETMARTVGKIIKDLREERLAIGMAKSDKRVELAKKSGIDITDREAVKKRIAEIDAEIASWESWHVNPELVKIVRERAGLPPRGGAQEEPAKEEPRTYKEDSGELDGFGFKDTFDLEGSPGMVGDKVNPKTGSESEGLFSREPEEGGSRRYAKGDFADRENETTKRDQDQEDADVRAYSQQTRRIIEMPEIVELAKRLTGRIPRVVTNMRPGEHGVFYGGGKKAGKIELNADTFKDPVRVAKALAHEIGHLVDWFKETGDFGGKGILGKLANLRKYMEEYLPEHPSSRHGILTEADRTRLRAEAERLAREEIETDAQTILREVPRYETVGVTPEMVKAIWSDVNGRDKYPDLYNILAGMSAAEKKEAIKKAIQGVVDERLAAAGERVQVGVDVVEETVQGRPVTEADIRAKFDRLFDEEVRRRGLFKEEQIDAELRELTRLWRPFDPSTNPAYTKYRHSKDELYADAVSVLLNDPALAERVAPTFYKAFHGWLSSKPEFKAAYDDLQGRAGDQEAVSLERDRLERESFREGDRKRLESQKESRQTIGEAVKKTLIDKNIIALEKANEADERAAALNRVMGTNIPENTGKSVRYWIEELPYISSIVHNYYSRVEHDVLRHLDANKVTAEDLGIFMKHARIIMERGDLANPGGYSFDTSVERLQRLEKTVGKEGMDALAEAARKFWEIRSAEIIPLLEKAGMFSPSLMKKIRDNQHYATFDVQSYMEKRYGRNMTGMVYAQHGTLQDVQNPFVATAMKDAALIRAAELTRGKRELVKMFRQVYSTEIQAADRGAEGFHIEPRSPDQGMIAFLEGGKMKAFYVPKGVAESFNTRPYEASALLRIWQGISQPIRALLVTRNPVWATANIYRDFMGTAKNIKEATVPKLLKHYAKTAGSAWRGAFKDEPSEMEREMLRKKELVAGRQFQAVDAEGENELDRTVREFGITPVQYRNKVLRPIAKTLERPPFLFVPGTRAAERFGKFGERWSKMAGKSLLKAEQAKTGRTDREISHLVRTRVGTPDMYRRGSAHNLTNNIFMFSNIGKEGWRASWEAAREAPGNYAWKTLKYNIAPKLIFALAGAGLFGDDLKKLYRKVSDYHKTNYMIVPLGLTEAAEKAVYLAIPQDYTGQIIGGIVQNIIDGKFAGRGGLLGYGVENTPYSLHPLVTAAVDLATYAVTGNAYDFYRDRMVIPDREAQAGGWDARKYMLAHLWREMGGSTLYRFQAEELEKVRTDLEKALDLPAGNVLGRFLKVSDYGEREANVDESKKVRQQQARVQMEVEHRVKGSVNELEGGDVDRHKVRELYRDLRQNGLIDRRTSLKEFRNRYTQLAEKAKASPHMEALLRAQTSEEKAHFLQKFEGEMEPADFDVLVATAKKAGLISKAVRKRWRRKQRGEQTMPEGYTYDEE